MWPFKKKPVVEEMPSVTEADSLMEKLKDSYKRGEKVKELTVDWGIYSDLFDYGFIKSVHRDQKGKITARLETGYGLIVRLKIK